MELRTGGPLPFRFDLNRIMVAGMLVFMAGALTYGAEAMGMLPVVVIIPAAERGGAEAAAAGDLTLGSLAFLVSVAGVALYFVGRVVQIVGAVAAKRAARSPEPEEA